MHQENLAARTTVPEIDAIMKTVVNIVNFIRARELNHRKFKSMLQELNSEYGEVLHTEVRWLSRTKVVERFYALRHEIILFLQQNNKVYKELEQNSWWCLLAFLCDITEKLGELNRRLQCEHKL